MKHNKNADVVRLNDQADPGHRRTVIVKARQRYNVVHTDTTASCDNVNVPTYAERSVNLGSYRQIALFRLLKKIDEQFLEDMREIILSIKRMDNIQERISLGFVEFDEPTMEITDLEKFLFNSRSKIYLVEHHDGVEHNLRDLYERFYRTQFLDVMFLSFDPLGTRIKAWVHTPFLIREVDI